MIARQQISKRNCFLELAPTGENLIDKIAMPRTLVLHQHVLHSQVFLQLYILELKRNFADLSGVG